MLLPILMKVLLYCSPELTLMPPIPKFWQTRALKGPRGHDACNANMVFMEGASEIVMRYNAGALQSRFL